MQNSFWPLSRALGGIFDEKSRGTNLMTLSL
jgi:hypothetical protein